ncbi:MAG: PTS sugar transporter subunit IIA [Clostridiales bacterium]|nr:PTS sugar transporter subunit IIA [Clostridiales bacterium]
MINLILVSHGSFAAGIREAAEMIFGVQENLEVFGVFPGDTVDAFSAKIEKAIEHFGDPKNTLILSDLIGGTPSNTAMMMALKHGVNVLSGLNLPMLIEVLSLREEAGIEEVAEQAAKVGREGIVCAAELMNA